MLTIITITKDDLQGLQKTIKSTENIRLQYQVNQMIIDSSNEDIKAKNQELIINQKNIEYIYQKPQGISKAFNYGLSLAKTEWIWFLNGGDELHDQLDLDWFIKTLKYGKNDAFIFNLEYNDGTLIQHPSLSYLYPPIPNWIPHPATIIKHKILLEFNGFREDFNSAMDGELWLRLFSNKNITTNVISVPLAKFELGGISNNLNNWKKHSSEKRKIIELHLLKILKIYLIKIFIVFKMWLKETKNSIFDPKKNK